MKAVAKLLLLLAPLAGAAPAPLLEGILGREGLLGRLTGPILAELDNAVKIGSASGVLSILRSLTPGTSPTTVEDVVAVLQSSAVTNASTVYQYSAQLISSGILSGTVEDLFSYVEGLGSAQVSSSNTNPDPPKSVYPQAKSCDPAYSVSEAKLRSAIYIPPTFTYGKKRPVILFPGTGSKGYISFRGNFIPLLTGVDWADPVWVNVPNFLLDDAQQNAEYAAYAMNYIASLTSRSDVGVIAWSQGNIDSQWAYKYWASTRAVVADHIAISPDYKGTIFADAVTFLVPGITNIPSVLQQRYMSTFITRMREGGGDSALVPTTSVWSGFFDEIVQPQSGTGASAYLKGATNVEVQQACLGKGLAGSFYTHESMLVNPLAFALAKDALTNDGPAQLSRIDLDTVCKSYLAPGLSVGDLLITENSNIIAAIAGAEYPGKVLAEPALKSYAVSASAQSC